MSFLSRAKEMTGHLAAAGRQRALKGKLNLEVRRLESKISSEKDAIGQALFPALEARTVQVEIPEVHEHMTAIAELQREVAEKRAEIESLAMPAPMTSEEAKTESVRKVDLNATPEASATQVAADVAAEERENPAEQGGEG